MSSDTVTAIPTSPVLSPCGPRPLQLLDSNVPSALNSPIALSSPRAHGLSTPPPTARNFRAVNPRRQSSISYFPSDHVVSPNCRSPTFAFNRPSPRRSQSVGIWDAEDVSAISRAKGDRRSLGNKVPLSASPAVDHGPLTLTEKHADLLQFIAQKEAKCLELRSQLAAHEAELSQLKRKWERIVSRGMDRAYSTQGSNVPYTQPLAVSAIIPTASAAIKEGARLLAAGLDLSAPDSTTSPVSGFATVSRTSLASSPAVQKIASRHGATQSLSSVSTATSSSTRSSSTPSSQRLSQSSASSLLSSNEDPIENDPLTDILSEHTRLTSLPTPPVETSEGQKLLRRRSQDRSHPPARSPLAPSPLATESPKSVSSATKVKPRPSSMVLGSPGNTSSISPVSAWMGSVGTNVGRKWEEIQKGDTFIKSQKRASVLLSDVSQSFFAALASPTPSAGPSPLMKPSPLSSAPPASSTSLLDDEPEQAEGEKATLGAVLVPSRVAPSPTPSPNPTQKKTFDDDDDWNW